MRINHEQEAKALELLKKLEASPAMQELVRQEQAETLKARQAAADRLSAIEGQQETELPALTEAVEIAEALAVKYLNLYKKACKEAGDARLKKASKTTVWDLQAGKERYFLAETASPEIDQAIEFFKEKERFLMQPERFSRQALGADKQNLVNLSTRFKFSSNRESIGEALDFVRAAKKALELLKLEAIFDPAKIEILKSQIPDWTRQVEYEGRRQKRDEMPKIPIISDAQALLHEVGRILRR
jgi:hypothetical protein